MSGLNAHVEAAVDPGFVWLRVTADSDPRHKPGLLISRATLPNVLLMLLDVANSTRTKGGDVEKDPREIV